MPKTDPVSDLRDAALEIADRAEEIIGTQEHTTEIIIEIRMCGMDFPTVTIRKDYMPKEPFNRRLQLRTKTD